MWDEVRIRSFLGDGMEMRLQLTNKALEAQLCICTYEHCVDGMQ